MRTKCYILLGSAALFLGPLYVSSQYSEREDSKFSKAEKKAAKQLDDPEAQLKRVRKEEEKRLKEFEKGPPPPFNEEELFLKLARKEEGRALKEVEKERRGEAPDPRAAQKFEEDRQKEADKIFQRLDVNRDGVLSSNELSDTLRQELTKWDANHDNVIDAPEYRAYFQARTRELSQAPRTDPDSSKVKQFQPQGQPTPLEESSRPVVYRPGKFPKELPDWFVKLDSDHDGQICLYEWRAASLPLGQFSQLDLNADGFLTPEEVLKTLAHLPPGGDNFLANLRPSSNHAVGNRDQRKVTLASPSPIARPEKKDKSDRPPKDKSDKGPGKKDKKGSSKEG